MSRQPYIGLRAFRRDDQDIFFGREQHTNELIERLNRQHFLAVVGDSGCGKSSLVKAGLIPSLQAGFMTEAGSHWRIAETRPGNTPFVNLTDALGKDTTLGQNYIADFTETPLNTSPFSLHELLVKKPLPDNAKLLIVCDQFEELFRYAKQQTNDYEAAAFAAFLLACANPYYLNNGDESKSIYVIVTMRSDYLGNCAKFTGLAEAINQGLYLTPRLNRQQLRSAIERPALVCNGKVEPALLVKLLGEVGNDADQLPLLQHVLMRLWNKAANVGTAEKQSPTTPEAAPYSSVSPIVVKLADYEDESIQTLKNALSTHADEAYKELSKSQQQIARQIFCRLTGAETGKADTRNPTKASDLMALTGQGMEQLEEVLKPFRQAGRCFLLPPTEVKLKPETMIDITHESLIRNWWQLEKWVQEEVESASIYRRLEQSALLHKDRKFGFYRTPELEIALDWYNKQSNRAVWSKRYGENYESAERFLLESEERDDKNDRVVYCNQVIKRFGAIQHFGELTLEQVKQRTSSIKMISKGKHNPFYKMQAINSLQEITPYHNIDLGTSLKKNDLTSQGDDEKECQWEFVYDANGNVIYEKLYNKKGDLISGFVYLPRNKNDLKAKAFYVGADGYPSAQQNTKAEFVEFTYSPLGDETEIRYFDRHHNPQNGIDGIHWFKQEFNKDGLIKKQTTFDAVSKPIEVEGFVTVTAEYDSMGNQIEWACFNAAGQPTLLKDGYHKSTQKYDDKGNAIEWVCFDIDGQPVLCRDIDGNEYHKLTQKYDDKGNTIEWACFDISGEPTLLKDGYHKLTQKYDDKGNTIEWAYFDIVGEPTLHKDGYHKLTQKYDDKGNTIEWAYFDIAGEPTLLKDGYHKSTQKYDDKGNAIEWACFDIDGQPVLCRDIDGNEYHKLTRKYDDKGNTIEWAYFDIAGEPTLHKDGFHKSTRKYDDKGNEIEWACFDADGQPTLHKDGYHKLTQKYDDKGNAIEWACFDIDGQPVLCRDIDGNEYHKLTRKYDDKGNTIEWAYFDIAGEPTLHKDGFHKSTRKYDDKGNEIEWACFDADGQPTLHKDGYHKLTQKYDDKGNTIEWAYFDIAGEPTLLKDGYHKSTQKYDDKGNAIEWACFDIDGQPVLCRDIDGNEYHKLTRKYDDKGNEIEWAYFDVAGQRIYPVDFTKIIRWLKGEL